MFQYLRKRDGKTSVVYFRRGKNRIIDPIGASTIWRWHGYENSWANVDGTKLQSFSGG
jgi:hypothetical protein